MLGRLLVLNNNNFNKRNVADVANCVEYIWILCSVYTIRHLHIVKRLRALFKEYKNLLKVTKSRRGQLQSFQNNLLKFKTTLDELFDIKCEDVNRIRNEGYYWGVKMEDEEVKFYQMQKLCPPQGCCSNTVDRHSEAKSRRMRKSLQEPTRGVPKEHEQSEMDELAIEFIENELSEEQRKEKNNDDKDEDFESAAFEQRRYSFTPSVEDPDDPIPMEYRHVRDGLRGVRPEVYKVAHKLESGYHMSRSQIEGAFVEVSSLFGRQWKAFEPNGVIDNDTLPSLTNLVRTRAYVEAMALNHIVEEIMCSEGGSVTYANDGSALNRVGSYMVQSITVNGVQRRLPSMPITTESHETLKMLQLTTLNILSAATGWKYMEDDIMKKIDFVMTDSTAHNLGVTELVCQELGIDEEDSPKTLLCNIHPLMCFQNKLKEFYNEVQQSFGNKKLDSCFTVDIDFKDENFVLKSIKCLTNFVNRANSAKPWNRHSHFTAHISPKPNETIELKDHRFNRLNDCCMVLLYHLDDIADYLLKYQHVTNNMAILDRSFSGMGDVLKPIYCATALLGIHIMRPFQRLLVDVGTTYTTLLTAFPLLHQEMSITDPSLLLTPEQVFKFLPNEMFKETLPKHHLLMNILECSREYEDQVVTIIGICLHKFQVGFQKQKGAIFGFGTSKDDATGTVLKISTLEDKSTLGKAPVTNLGEERSVGSLNFELDFRGRDQFQTCSQNLVLNTSFDLLAPDFDNYRGFKKQAKEIKNIKGEWCNKMAELEKEGLSKQEIASLTQENKKLRDLDFLKAQDPPGPFSSAEEVDTLMRMDVMAEEEKNKRLYIEVRYAKYSTTSIKRASTLFRLKASSKNLDSEDYAQNLRVYFGCINSVNTISLEDFAHVLTGLRSAATAGARTLTVTAEPSASVTRTPRRRGRRAQGVNNLEVPEQPAVETDRTDLTISINNLEVGSHISAVWTDELDRRGERLSWYIGVVESVDKNRGSAKVSYMKQTQESSKANWQFPESAMLFDTPIDQIIASDLPVEYSCVTIIRCKLRDGTVSKINGLFELYNASFVDNRLTEI